MKKYELIKWTNYATLRMSLKGNKIVVHTHIHAG